MREEQGGGERGGREYTAIEYVQLSLPAPYYNTLYTYSKNCIHICNTQTLMWCIVCVCVYVCMCVYVYACVYVVCGHAICRTGTPYHNVIHSKEHRAAER